jgi:hypothetical protein
MAATETVRRVNRPRLLERGPSVKEGVRWFNRAFVLKCDDNFIVAEGISIKI